MTKPIMLLCAKRRLRSVWASMPFCWFCHEAAHIERYERLQSSDLTVHTSQFKVHNSWMDDLRFHIQFNSISVISGRWKGEHKKLCAMKRRLG